jgi:oxygen-independent coproporphyrinogen-3 oxidase
MCKDNSGTAIPVELLRKYDRPGPRYTSYPTAPTWNDQITAETYKTSLRTAAKQPDLPFAIYSHIPFCQRRCLYCGCNTYVSGKKSNVDDYIDRFIAEIKTVSELMDQRKNVNQLHFGGGTPTFIGIEGLEKIMTSLESEFQFIEDCEKSIEVDPRVTTPEHLEFLAGRGFNRASIGVQDLDPDVQKAIGRVQSEELVTAILDHCRRLGFKGINFDLIYGLPLQTAGKFSRTLERIIELRPDRMALYSFAYLPDLKVHQSKIRPEDLPSAEGKYRLFSDAVEKFTAAGYRQIGMDHFALPDDELTLAQNNGRLHRNFMGYTIRTAPDMIGLGMSAIGYIDNTFFQNDPKLISYRDAIANSGVAVYRGKRLNSDDLIRQFVISSLMCNFELNRKLFQDRFEVDFNTYFDSELKNLDGFIGDKFLERTTKGLEVTERGRTFVRNIAMVFDSYLRDLQSGSKPLFSRTV